MTTQLESQLVLLLDDDLMVTEGIAAALERERRTIITCNDVESAQLVAERLKPSHIVADIHLAGPFNYDGLDFIRYAKRHTPESRIILISGDSQDALQFEAADRGAVAFLRKPFDVRELDAMLNLMVCSELTSGADLPSVIRMPLLDQIMISPTLAPFYQPIVRLDGTWRHFGYESLARLRSESPFRNPEVLFNYAARKQRLADLEFACTARTFATGATLARSGLLFINIHPDVFCTGASFTGVLASSAEGAGIPLNRVVLEITEQGQLEASSVVLKTIRDLGQMGVRFAFDDLGIAYSHLPFIDRIRPSFLKISQDFGTAFETDPTKMKIVANLLSLARDFSCDLILEGIESKATAEAAADLGIPLGQGFYFGRPSDASTLLGSA